MTRRITWTCDGCGAVTRSGHDDWYHVQLSLGAVATVRLFDPGVHADACSIGCVQTILTPEFIAQAVEKAA